MPIRSAALVASALSLWAIGFAHPAAAETLALTVEGKSLAINDPCAASVTVSVDPSLSHAVALEASASDATELQTLRFAAEHEAATLRNTRNRCWDGATPTLSIRLRLPPGFGVSVSESGDAVYTLPQTGALSLDVAGDAHVQAGATGALAVDASGAPEITVADAHGGAQVEISGAGTVTLQQAALTALHLEISGSGHFTEGPGSIGALALEISGSGNASIAATVGTGSVELTGSGQARIARVTGALSQSEEGSGRLTIAPF